ncbi:MAG: beta-N-acetylhexosaminidase [Candidatus Sumerlaeaceae bacterium]|nr:beta-N-acetylhexosaminidase [Candidatus Sumerlaeaceae bacterium]
MRHCLAFAILPVLVLTAPSLAKVDSSTTTLPLVPMPRQITRTAADSVPIASSWVIVTPDTDADRYAAALLAEEVSDRFGWNWALANSATPAAQVRLSESAAGADDPPLFATQGYRLVIKPGRILIEAATPAGRFYGVQTLRQLIRAAAQPALPALEVRDWPALEWRGVSDDISRGQVSTLDDFRDIIRQLAYHKKNLYQPYIEDMFEFDADPAIGRERGAITKAEMAAILEEARRNHVTLTPVFETLGHQDRLLSLPHNRKYAELQDPSTRPWSFSPALPEAVEFVKTLVDEVATATPGPFFHIGGDESFDIGKGQSAELVKQLGVSRVHVDYFTTMIRHLAANHGRQSMLYADMLIRHPEALDLLPREAILVDWHYHKHDQFTSVPAFKKAGFRNIFTSPGLWSWTAFYPNWDIAFANITNAAAVAKREGLMGCIASSWGDEGAENLRLNNFAGWAFAAASEWEQDATTATEFFRRYVAAVYGADSPSLAEAHLLVGDAGRTLEMPYPAKVFHKGPAVRRLDAAWLDKVTRLRNQMVRARALIAASTAGIRRHRDQIESLDLAARRYLWMAERDLLMDSIAAAVTSAPMSSLTAADRREIHDDLALLRNELHAIIAEYQRLWMRRYKYPMFQDNLERLQRQLAALQGLVAAAQAGQLALAHDHVAWIWTDEGNPAAGAPEGTRYFVRSVELDREPVYASLKCWADDRARVFVNGQPVLEAEYSKPPISAQVRDHLTTGVNIIAIEADNGYGSAGVALTLELRSADGHTTTITGDAGWRASTATADGWTTALPEGDSWKKARVLGRGMIPPWDFVQW